MCCPGVLDHYGFSYEGSSVMHNQQQPRRRIVRCIALHPQDEGRHKFLLIGACLIASALIALWLAHLPQVIGSPRNSFNIMPQHRAENSVNRLHKSDRLARTVGASFDARWSGIATVTKSASMLTRTILTAVEGRHASTF